MVLGAQTCTGYRSNERTDFTKIVHSKTVEIKFVELPIFVPYYAGLDAMVTQVDAVYHMMKTNCFFHAENRHNFCKDVADGFQDFAEPAAPSSMESGRAEEVLRALKESSDRAAAQLRDFDRRQGEALFAQLPAGCCGLPRTADLEEASSAYSGSSGSEDTGDAWSEQSEPPGPLGVFVKKHMSMPTNGVASDAQMEVYSELEERFLRMTPEERQVYVEEAKALREQSQKAHQESATIDAAYCGRLPFPPRTTMVHGVPEKLQNLPADLRAKHGKYVTMFGSSGYESMAKGSDSLAVEADTEGKGKKSTGNRKHKGKGKSKGKGKK